MTKINQKKIEENNITKVPHQWVWDDQEWHSDVYCLNCHVYRDWSIEESEEESCE